MKRLYALLAASLALGAVHALAFAPEPFPAWALPILQIVAFAGLCLVVWRTATVRQALAVGMLFGLGHFGIGISWIYISLHEYAYMPAPLAALAVLLLAAYLSLFPVLATGVARCLSSRWLRAADGQLRSRFAAPGSAIAMATSWTAAEWIRGTLFTGFPWLNVGYAHVDGPLHGWAPLLGVYGVAFVATLTGASLAAALFFRSRAAQPAIGRPAMVSMSIAILLLALGAAASLAHWVTPFGRPLAIRLVQGNIPLSDKFDPAQIWRAMDLHRSLSEQARGDGRTNDLILLPETVVPVFQDQLLPEGWEDWISTARHTNSTLVMGVAIREAHPDRDYYYNGVIGLNAETPADALVSGVLPQRYNKRHLVPFGEFIPPGFHWFVNEMVMPLGDFDRGATRQQPFDIAGQHVALNVCYEDVFGEELLPAIRPFGDKPGATILANVSNLAWFGDSLALPQHLQMSRMRVRETGRPMLRATNTGMTAVIDAQAHVDSVLTPLTVGVLDGTVQGTTGLTPYARIGNLPVLVLLGVLLIALIWRRRTAR